MLNILFSLAFALFSFESFIFTTTFNALNRTVFSIPKALFEKSIIVIQDANDSMYYPYFSKTRLEENIDEYFSVNLSNYKMNFSLSYSYYEVDTKIICRVDECQGVKVILNAKIMEMFPYQKSVFYEIVKGVNHE
jgi:hypothetical protein